MRKSSECLWRVLVFYNVDTISCNIKITRDPSWLVIAFIFTNVPSNIWIYTIFILYFFSFSIVKVKKFWFSFRGGDMTQYTHTVLINTRTLMHLHDNTRSRNNNTKYKKQKYPKIINKKKKIHPNNTSKPAFFLCKVRGEAKKSQKEHKRLSLQKPGFVLVSSILLWFPYEPE